MRSSSSGSARIRSSAVVSVQLGDWRSSTGACVLAEAGAEQVVGPEPAHARERAPAGGVGTGDLRDGIVHVATGVGHVDAGLVVASIDVFALALDRLEPAAQLFHPQLDLLGAGAVEPLGGLEPATGFAQLLGGRPLLAGRLLLVGGALGRDLANGRQTLAGVLAALQRQLR